MAATKTSSKVQSLLEKHPDDVVVTLALRTPMTRGKRGAFKDTHSDALLYSMLKAVNERSGLDPGLVEEIAVGAVHVASPVYEARAAAIAAGFPEHVPVQAINRLCSSGLMAVRSISDAIARGDVEIGLAVGCESMSLNPRPTPQFHHEALLQNQASLDCGEPMGWTSEMVAQDFEISREAMDDYAIISHTKAAHAQKSGAFKDEIVPVKTSILVPADPKNPKDLTNATRKEITVTEDEIRLDHSRESLSGLRSAFPKWGAARSTAGNSSPVTDGAAAVLMMTRRKAEELGLPILGKHVSTVTVGVAPRHMGISPATAIPKLLEKTGLTMDDIDLFEVNEAFASMMVYVNQKLNLPMDKTNVNGGAIALGHPLGCTGVRQVVTGLSALNKRNGKVLLTSMCIGSGMGAAALFIGETPASAPSSKI